MQIPQLQVETTKAILGLQIDQPVQEIEQPQATQQIEQPAAILEISTTKSQLSIDTTENRADLDLKSARRRIAENAQYGVQQGMEGIARRAQEGQQLMRIEDGGQPLVSIAKQNTMKEPAPLGIRFVGDPFKLQIEFTPGKANIDAKLQKPIINAQVNKPIHTYTPGKVTRVLEQKPSITIDWKV